GMFATRAKKTQGKRRREVDAEGDDGAHDGDIPVPVQAEARKKLNTFSSSSKKPNAQEVMDARFQADARAILEKNIKLNADGNELSGKIYQGQAGYKNYATKKEASIGMNKYTGTQGPIRAQTWARSICRFDYAPDICKDYKETGFCGYGDNCKFLHDRGDYKSGWQIDKEWNEKERKKAHGKDDDDDGESDDDKYVIKSDDDDEQFACTICRNPFTNAVETICGHFFCEKCALKRYKKTSLCFNCRKQTNGG
ncbi:hypothetical protein DYB32_001005, partial [Aphanomyces invadans]